MADRSVFHKIFLIISVLVSSQAGEYTFELADRDQQCFHEQFSESGKEAILEFQVLYSFVLFVSYCCRNVP